MAIGDVYEVASLSDVYYVDTGMFDVPEYGAVYLLDTERPTLVDSGIGTEHTRVLDAMDAVGIEREDLATIALTHVHLDHAGGAGFLASKCPNAQVAVHEIGAPHVVDTGRLVEGTKRAVGDQWQYYREPEPLPEDRVRSLSEGDVIDIGDRSLSVYHAPGHAPHQVVFHEPEEGAVFSGDAAGIWIPSRGELRPTSPPPNFDLEQCLDDVETIAGLDPDVVCVPHFGPASAETILERYPAVLANWIDTVDDLRGDHDRESIVDRITEREDPDPWGKRKHRAETTLNVTGALRYLERAESG